MVQGSRVVSVRATILALHRFGIAPSEQIKLFERAWNKHRRETGIDINGKLPHNNSKQDAHHNENASRL
jgi:hypothetical protein